MGVPPDMRAGIVEAAAVPIWPENLPAFEAFAALLTQWRVGMSGATGLDYAAIPATLDMLGVSADRRALFADLRAMEAAALDAMRERRNG